MSRRGDEIPPDRVAQPWSDTARRTLVPPDRRERMRRSKVARFQDRLADMVVDNDVDAQPVALVIAVVMKFGLSLAITGLTYVTIWLTRGSGWSPGQVATGVAASVVLGLIGGGIWHRMQHPELEPPDADVHAPDEWSLLRSKSRRDESESDV